MKRWNWPTTILYIKHKKANLKQGCSKLVGKKRKAPTGGWSGGLNCPIGTEERKNALACPSPDRVKRRTSAPPPGRARPKGLDNPTEVNHSAAQTAAALALPEAVHPETRLPPPRGCIRPPAPSPPTAPGYGLPGGPGTAERSARQCASSPLM